MVVDYNSWVRLPTAERLHCSGMERLFRTTMSGLETGLRVAQIATFNLDSCTEDQDASVVLGSPALSDFDQIPVRHKSRVIGVLERNGTAKGSVRESMRPLDDSLLVSSDEPLTRFVPLLKKHPYRLVLVGTEIKGIVTRSDIAKAPVRLLAFTLVSHLEMIMTDLIRKRCPDDQDVLRSLDEQRRKKLESRLKRKRGQNLVLAVIELADLSDKRYVLSEICGLGQKALHELKEIEELRNAVAHARDYAKTDDDLSAFIERMSLTRNWIKRVPELGAGKRT